MFLNKLEAIDKTLVGGGSKGQALKLSEEIKNKLRSELPHQLDIIYLMGR